MYTNTTARYYRLLIVFNRYFRDRTPRSYKLHRKSIAPFSRKDSPSPPSPHPLLTRTEMPTSPRLGAGEKSSEFVRRRFITRRPHAVPVNQSVVVFFFRFSAIFPRAAAAAAADLERARPSRLRAYLYTRQCARVRVYSFSIPIGRPWFAAIEMT